MAKKEVKIEGIQVEWTASGDLAVLLMNDKYGTIYRSRFFTDEFFRTTCLVVDKLERDGAITFAEGTELINNILKVYLSKVPYLTTSDLNMVKAIRDFKKTGKRDLCA